MYIRGRGWRRWLTAFVTQRRLRVDGIALGLATIAVVLGSPHLHALAPELVQLGSRIALWSLAMVVFAGITLVSKRASLLAMLGISVLAVGFGAPDRMLLVALGISLLHSLVHWAWPFVSEKGYFPEVNHTPDITVHAVQHLFSMAVILGATTPGSTIATLILAYAIVGLIGHLVAIWASRRLVNTKHHERFVDLTIFSALASGSFVSALLFYGMSEWINGVGLLALAGISMFFYWFFRANDERMKVLYRVRFFDIYFTGAVWVALLLYGA